MQFISAEQIHNGRHFLEKDTVLVVSNDGTIRDIVPLASIDRSQVKFHEGILCPGFVNAHCHLELSHFKGRIPQHTGIVEFALNIIKTRNTSPLEEIHEKAAEADKEMWHNGIVAVGDISNTNHTIPIKSASKIHYHTFVELLGLNPARAEQVFADGKALQAEYAQARLSASLAPHAPYTVSNELMAMVAQEHAISSIHNQESEQENLFFENKSGDFLKLYSSLNIPIDFFQASGQSSLRSYLPHLKNDQALLLVHNTCSSKEDIAFAENLSDQLTWCLCANANLYIENKLPAIDLLSGMDCRICLGTDSLASNHSLSIVSEMQAIAENFPGIGLEKLIIWATYKGASFLGLEDRFGLFAKNKAPGINLISWKGRQSRVEKLF